jgi:hypothetical protein
MPRWSATAFPDSNRGTQIDPSLIAQFVTTKWDGPSDTTMETAAGETGFGEPNDIGAAGIAFLLNCIFAAHNLVDGRYIMPASPQPYPIAI